MRYFQSPEDLQKFLEACPQWHVFPDPRGPWAICVPHFMPSKNSKDLTNIRRDLAVLGIRLKVAFNRDLKRWDILGAV